MNDKFFIRDFQVEIGNGSNIAGVNFLNVTAANGSHNALILQMYSVVSSPVEGAVSV